MVQKIELCKKNLKTVKYYCLPPLLPTQENSTKMGTVATRNSPAEYQQQPKRQAQKHSNYEESYEHSLDHSESRDDIISLLTTDNDFISHQQRQIHTKTTRSRTVESSTSSSATTDGPVRKKAQNKHKSFSVIHFETSKLLGVYFRKHVTQLSQKTYNNICNTALSHLLCLSGYRPYKLLEENIECFVDVMVLFLGVKF